MQAPFVDPLLGLEQFQKALPLVGRAAEMQMMRTLLNTVLHNIPYGPRAITLSGEVGVGKSRLLAEVYKEAQGQGFRVLAGHAYETSNMFPYLPFVEILRPLIHSITEQQLRTYLGIDGNMSHAPVSQDISLTGMPLIAALTYLFPELPKLLHTTIEYEELLPDQKKFRLLDAIATLLERVALEQPVLLSIDNVQWADSASLELMVYLTVRLHTSKVALIGVIRPPRAINNWADDDPSIALRASTAATKTLSDLMRYGLLLLLPVGPMDDESAAQHLSYLLPGNISPYISQTLLNRAEGNPFFLEELVRTLTLNQHLILQDGTWQATKRIDTVLPESITLAVEQRMRGLSNACREMLRVAALFGRTFPLDALLPVLHTTQEDVQPLVDEATDAALIAKTSLAESILADENENTVFSSIDYLPALETAHLLPTVYLFCQGIVQEVLSADIPQQQAQSLHGGIGAALEAHYGIAAPTHAAELALHYALSGEKEATLHWCLLAGEDAARKQAHREAISHFRLALKLLEANVQLRVAFPVPSSAQIHLTIGESWFKLGQLDLAAQSFQQTLAMAQQLRAEETAWSLSMLLAQANRQLSDVYRMQGNYEQARTFLQAASVALDTEKSLIAVSDMADSVRVLEHAAPIVAKSQLALWFDQELAPGSTRVMNAQRINLRERILLLQAQATLDLMHYHSEKAEAALWESYRLATEIGDRSSQAFALHFVGWIRGWGEHIHLAIGLIKQANELYSAVADPFRATLGDQALGIIYTALGEMEEAQYYTSRGLARSHRFGVQYNLGWLYGNQGVLALFQGDWDGSADYFQQAMQEATINSNARLKPVVLQAQAELQFRRGNWLEAEQLFLSCLSAAAATEWYPGALALYGHFLAVTGRRTAAREQLDRAIALPEPQGFAGDFYIPFLAEGYIHLSLFDQAAIYTEPIRALRGFMYYGNSVDRILGVIAAQAKDWEVAEQSFADGLVLCRRAKNQPEEGAILYEQARCVLMRSGAHMEDSQQMQQLLEQMHSLCDQARDIFTRYDMHRSVDLVDMLQEGAKQLEQIDAAMPVPVTHRKVQVQTTASGHTLHLNFTRRELDVLRLVAEGHTDREVADALVISPRTVNRHLSNIFVKLDVPGRAAAVAYAIRVGVV